MNDRKKRIGIIGFGQIGSFFYQALAGIGLDRTRSILIADPILEELIIVTEAEVE